MAYLQQFSISLLVVKGQGAVELKFMWTGPLILADWQNEFSSSEPLVTFGHVVLNIKSSDSEDENGQSVSGLDKYASAVAEILALFFMAPNMNPRWQRRSQTSCFCGFCFN